MSEFPRREAEIEQLALLMITGISMNPTIFPSCSPAPIQAAVGVYNTKKENEGNVHALAKIATQEKDAALEGLVDVMQIQRRKAEVDCVNDPQKLSIIGDDPASGPKTMPVPGQVKALEATIQGPDHVTLDWKTPGRQGGVGTVRAYLVQRRDEPSGGGTFGPWTLVATVISETEIVLQHQPRGVTLEYRVIAVNASGEGPPSASVVVVL